MDEISFPNPKPASRSLPAVARSAKAGLIAYKTFADVAGKGSMFVITIVAARRLAPHAFGVFALGTTLGWLMMVATDFGMQMHVARAIARAPSAAGPLLAAWLRARTWTTAVGLAAIAIGFAVFGVHGDVAVPIAILALAYACNGLIEFLNYGYRGLSRSDLESALTLWQRGAMLVLGVAALAWRADVTLLAVAMLIPAIATLLASLRIASRVASHPADPAHPALPALPAGSIFHREVWPIGAGILLSALYFRVDVFLVQRWSGTEAVALYNAVFRLVDALRLFPAAVLAVMLPALCRARDLRLLTRTALALTFAAGVASAALWTTASWSVPLLYGDAYGAAVPAFRILLLAVPLLALNNVLTMQLVSWDGQRSYAALCGIALVVNLALNAWLIPAHSIQGAAWATLGTEIVLTVGCAVALATALRRVTASEPFFFFVLSCFRGFVPWFRGQGGAAQ